MISLDFDYDKDPDYSKSSTAELIMRVCYLSDLLVVDKNTKPSDLGRPGHIFPLKSVKGGVLRRSGHTEAAIDLAALAGLQPAGVLIEILKPNLVLLKLNSVLKITIGLV